MVPGNTFQRARARTAFSQDDVASALGVSRAMVSYWESGKRRPNERQLSGMARLYRVSPEELLGLGEAQGPDLAEMLFRGAEEALPEGARPGLRELERFLDAYATLAAAVGWDVRGLRQSPFPRGGFETQDDARRKAEEVRATARLGLGPIPDLDDLCELLGITVYRAALGSDLGETISGAFFRHPEIGFSILVNLEMTPGRRRFTIAHELAHAFFHSDRNEYVLSFASRSPAERFADQFAGELLMPTEGVRRVLEERGIAGRITDPAEVIHLQRYYRVSYPTALVRLRQAKLLSTADYRAFQRVRPVKAALALGYEIDADEWEQDPDDWRIARYPHRFLAVVREAFRTGVASPMSLASMMDLSVDEVLDLVGTQWDTADGANRNQLEIEQFEASGVAER